MGSVRAQAPERPGWMQTIANVLLAWLLTVVTMFVAYLPLSLLALDPSLAFGHGSPWRIDGPWALVAAVWPAVLAALLYAQVLCMVVRRLDGWEVRRLPVALATFVFLLATTASSDDGRSFAGMAFIALMLVVNYGAYTQTASAPRLSRAAWVAVAAVAVTASVATLAYQPLHPLRFGVSRQLDPRALEVDVRNEGLGDARIRAIRAEPASGGAAVVAQAYGFDRAYAEDWQQLPVGGVALARTPDGALPSGISTRVRLAPGSCADPGSRASVDALVFELETLGVHRTQHVTLPRPVTLSCPR